MKKSTPTPAQLSCAANIAQTVAYRVLSDARAAFRAGQLSEADFLIALDNERYAAGRAERLGAVALESDRLNYLREHAQDPTQNTMVAYLREHGITACAGTDGKLLAIEVFCIDGVAEEKLSVIEPNFRAVRLWLGY